MQRLVAIRYSHVRTDACSLNWSSPRQAASSLRGAKDSVAVQLQLMPVGVGQLAEGVVLAGARTGQYPLAGTCHDPILASALPLAATRPTDVAAARNSPLSFRCDRRLIKQSNERRTEMGTIVISGPQNASLDGVVQDPDGAEGFRLGGWFREFGGTDLEAWNKVALAEALAAEAWLLGRKSYEFFGARWRPRSGELADRLNSMPKYVVSSILEDPDWNNSTVLKGDLVEEVSKLKHELDGEIVVPASYQLARTLIEHDLVDELRLVVFPVVLGEGKRLFGEASDTKPMRLVETKTIGNGLVFLTYQFVRDA